MRMTAVIVCVPLLAGALAAQSPVNGRLPGQSRQGLTVMLLPPSPQTHDPLRFVLNEPAYVAAFIVYPGAGVRLLYPLVNTPERLHRAGYNTEQLYGASFDNDVYSVVLGPTFGDPSYLYVIASRHPLDVTRYVHRPMRLASAVGQRESRSFYADVAFDALLNNAVALGDDASWDADVFVLWPNDGTSENLPHRPTVYTTVLCTDGSTRIVPIGYPFVGCPGQQRVRPSAQLSRPTQQSASAAAAVSSQTQRAELASATAREAPTVLPTIIGAHITDAQRRTAIQQEVASQRVMYTAANGDQPVAAQPAEAASQAQLQVIEFPVRIRDRRGRDEGRDEGRGHGQHSAEPRNQNVGTTGSPQLAPNPRLPPNPVLAPAPRLAPNPGMSQRQERPGRIQ